MCARVCRSALLGGAVLMATTVGFGHDQLPGAAQTRPVLLQGGDLYTVSDGVLEGSDLLFDDGVIVAIGVGLEPPADAEIVNVRGSRVYPGLIAPQTTLGLREIGAVRATLDLDEVGSVNPEVTAHVAFNPDSEILPTVRSHGVTTAQVVPQGSLIRGRSFITHLDGWTKEDAGVELVDALHLSWPRAAVIDAWWMRTPPEEQRERMAEERRSLRETFDEARAYHRARQSDEGLATDARWEAMRPLWSGELPVFITANDYRQIVEAIAFAEEYGLRMVLVGAAEADRLTDLLRDRQVPVVLDVATGLPYRDDDDYDRQYRLAATLLEAGVSFGLGTLDGATGVRNLAIEGGGHAVAHGLPPEAALRALTLSTAEILGIADRQGSLEIGKEATLFVSEGDVLDVLTQKVTHMYIQGRRVDLDNKHRELYRKYREKIRRLAAE